MDFSNKIIRQGDVKLIKVNELPANARKIEGKVLQESEVTGHHHHFKKDAALTIYETADVAAGGTITPDLGKYIIVEEDTILYHGKGFEPSPAKTKTGDHEALRVPPGTYKISITREYDYERNEVGRVVD